MANRRFLCTPSGHPEKITHPSKSFFAAAFRIASPTYPLLCGYSASYKRCLCASMRPFSASIRQLSASIRRTSETDPARDAARPTPSASAPRGIRQIEHLKTSKMGIFLAFTKRFWTGMGGEAGMRARQCLGGPPASRLAGREGLRSAQPPVTPLAMRSPISLSMLSARGDYRFLILRFAVLKYASETLEDVYATIWRGRSGQGSLPCSTPRQSRARTSPGSPHTRRLPPRPGVGSSNRR